MGVSQTLWVPRSAPLAVAGTTLPVASPLPLPLLLVEGEAATLLCALTEPVGVLVSANNAEAVVRIVIAPFPLPIALPLPLMLILGLCVIALIPVESAVMHADPLGGPMLLLGAEDEEPLAEGFALLTGEFVALPLPLPAHTVVLPAGLPDTEAVAEADDISETVLRPVTDGVAEVLRVALGE